MTLAALLIGIITSGILFQWLGGMGAGTGQDQFVLDLAPNEQPVRFDVAFTNRPPLAGERMRAMSRLQRFVLQQLLERPTSDRIMICWIVAITLVAIFGPAWVAVLMFGVMIGGPSAAHALTGKLGLGDRN